MRPFSCYEDARLSPPAIALRFARCSIPDRWKNLDEKQVPKEDDIMDAIDCIKTRRSIRKFKPDPVPRETIMEILDCARHSPYAGAPAWQFTIITDPKQKQEVVALKKTFPSPWAVNAPVLIGVSVDLSQSKRWIETGSIAATTILLATHALGLGACWVAMRYDDTILNARIQRALGLSENVFPICLIALGYPDEIPKEKHLRDLHSLVR